MSSSSLLTVLVLLLFTWLIGVQIAVLRSNHDSELAARAVLHNIEGVNADIQASIKTMKAMDASLQEEGSKLLQELADIGADVEEALSQSRESQVKAKKDDEVLMKSPANADLGGSYEDRAKRAGVLHPERVGALQYVGDLPRLEDPTANVIRSYTTDIYELVYKYAEYQAQIVAWREAFQPMIDAIEKRWDRMLYNYI